MARPHLGDNLSPQEGTMEKLNMWRNLWRNQQGQDMTEYALMGGLMATVAVAIMPDMFSIVGHVSELLLSVLESAVGVALK
jgi:Flp pilus assembly pilin Flp